MKSGTLEKHILIVLTVLPTCKEYPFQRKVYITAQASAKVSWDSCCQAKEQGGLGLRNLEAWNAACAIKMIWLIFFAEGSIWASWFIQEMLQGNLQLFWVINTRQKHSWLVKKLLEFRPLVFSWFRQRVGNGETCYFWSGNWSPFGKLSDFLETSGSLRYPIPKEATLAELWENGAWILPNARSDKQVETLEFHTGSTTNYGPKQASKISSSSGLAGNSLHLMVGAKQPSPQSSVLVLRWDPKKITLTVKNRISSLRSDRPAFSSALMQLWFSS
ncbi:hypothetical protein YC2023_075225 [Brassica napus]